MSRRGPGIRVHKVSFSPEPNASFYNGHHNDDREPYRFGRVFDLIEEGKVAMMQSPCLYQGSRSEFSAAERDKWVATQFSTLSKTPVQTVEESWTTFVADYSNKSESELRSTIESEIVKDLTHLEVQPAIRESYRRFVVIKATQDEHINMSKEGVSEVRLSQ